MMIRARDENMGTFLLANVERISKTTPDAATDFDFLISWDKTC